MACMCAWFYWLSCWVYGREVLLKHPKGCLILETGEKFYGCWRGGAPKAGEVVFNTSHSGYEEMATDPSYFSQILITTAPQQGNYGVDSQVWESEKIHIAGFIALEMQQSARDRTWLERLTSAGVPVLTDLDTRALVIQLRSRGTVWGALVPAEDDAHSEREALKLIEAGKNQPRDWTALVSVPSFREVKGQAPSGPRLALLDFGCKKNILREILQRASTVGIFPASATASDIKAWIPEGIVISNGPGDPADVTTGIQTVRDLIGWRHMFGICMGHQLMALALGGETFKMKFGHRGSNHPIRDELLNQVYMTSQNHGYAVKNQSLPQDVKVTHTNLNDNTVAGIYSPGRKLMAVQFHPESHPGPHDAQSLFDFFVRQLQ